MTDSNARPGDKAYIEYLSPNDFAQRLKKEPKLFILDVRDPSELEGELAALPGAVNIPLQQLEQRLSELSILKGDIVVVCRSGRRSERAARMLREAGVERVFVLAGGMRAWHDTRR